MGEFSFYIPKRYILCSLICTGFLIMNCQRSCLSVAIVSMTSKTKHLENGEWHNKDAEFEWNSEKKGIILGAFFYGYLILQIPGGWLCMKFGGKTVLGFAIFISSFINLLLPLIVRTNEYFFFLARVFQGLVLGVSLSCNLSMWSKWAPTKEKSSLVSFSVAGLSAGMLTSYPISGLLCQYGFAGGWPSVFYVFGGLGVIWTFLWYKLVSDTPLAHPSISTHELAAMDQIESSVNNEQERVPWCSIFTSLSVMGLVIANFAFDCSYYTLLVTMPLFLRDVHKFNVATTGIVSALPWLFMTIMTPMSGFLSDKISNHFSVGFVRKLFYNIGMFGSGIFLIISSQMESSELTIAMLCLGVTFFGFGFAGFMVNPMDIAPKYAGIIIGISNSFSTIPGFAGPALVGIMTKNETQQEWVRVMYCLAAAGAIGGILFITLGSGNIQPWAQYEITPEKKEKELNELTKHKLETKIQRRVFK